jgi:hypothetical protein
MKDLSIIIVNYNTRELLRACIESIKKFTEKFPYEIIVVDNASSDKSIEYLSKEKVKFIKNSSNLGFAKANNQGIKIAKGRYILLLNSDTKLKTNVLREMVEWMDRNPEIGIATCALKNPDGSQQAAGGYFPSLVKILVWMFFLENIPFIDTIVKPFHPKTRMFNNKREQDWVTGAFFLVRRNLFDQIGLLDEDYFMYVEEMDFCYRAKQKGWQVWFLPQWSVIHYGGASGTKEFSLLSEYKGIKIFYKKHYPPWQYPILRFFLKLGALGRMIILGIIRGPAYAKIYAKAFRTA